MMVCLHFYTLLLRWTSTMLRRYQARLFDLKSLFCGSYICIQWSVHYLVTDVRGQPITPNLKGQTVKETYFMGNVCL